MRCRKLRNISAFTRHTNRKFLTIYDNYNCQSKYLIYLMKYTLCKIKYVRKAETPFNIHLNNHRPNVSDPNTISVWNYAQRKHGFNIFAKFILIKMITIRNKPTEVVQHILRKRKKIWIDALKVLRHSLNQKL